MHPMLRQGSRIVTVMVAVEILTSLALGATATALGWQAYERQHDPLVLACWAWPSSSRRCCWRCRRAM